MTLQNKISSYIESVDEKVIYYILGGILFSVFLLDYFVLMRPQIASLSKISPEIRLLSDDINKAKDDILQNAFFGIQLPKNLIPKDKKVVVHCASGKRSASRQSVLCCIKASFAFKIMFTRA